MYLIFPCYTTYLFWKEKLSFKNYCSIVSIILKKAKLFGKKNLFEKLNFIIVFISVCKPNFDKILLSQ